VALLVADECQQQRCSGEDKKNDEANNRCNWIQDIEFAV